MSQRPNVIVFFTDQQRWDSTGVHGNPLDLTPNFDQMAQRGTHLFHTFTCQPVCGPARAVLQTGKYATTVGCWRNGIVLPATERTLAHHFHEAGYRTAYIGKWHLANQQAVPAEQRGGYEYSLAANALEHSSDAYDTRMYDGDNQEVKLPGYRVDAQTDAAIRYIDAHQHESFFLFLSFLEPHFQNHRDDYPAPDVYRDRYHGRYVPPDLAVLGGSAHAHLGGYWGMVKRLDEALGRLQDALKSLKLAENTIILFTTDHGCHFKTRNSEYKRSCHDSSIRIPTALIGGPFTGGGRVEKLISLVDLPATLLDAAGIPVPKEMQGRSVLPLLGGRKAEWPDDMFVQISEAVAGAVHSDASPTSLELTLEHKKIAERRQQYRQPLADLLKDKPDAIGFVFAINGQVNTGEVYASHDLFRRLWGKLLDAAVVEAVAESGRPDQTRRAAAKSLTAEDIQRFLDQADSGPDQPQSLSDRVCLHTKRTLRSVLFETEDKAIQDARLHQNYIWE